jgi:hypothetical protein
VSSSHDTYIEYVLLQFNKKSTEGKGPQYLDPSATTIIMHVDDDEGTGSGNGGAGRSLRLTRKLGAEVNSNDDNHHNGTKKHPGRNDNCKDKHHERDDCHSKQLAVQLVIPERVTEDGRVVNRLERNGMTLRNGRQAKGTATHIYLMGDIIHKNCQFYPAI